MYPSIPIFRCEIMQRHLFIALCSSYTFKQRCIALLNWIIRCWQCLWLNILFQSLKSERSENGAESPAWTILLYCIRYSLYMLYLNITSHIDSVRARRWEYSAFASQGWETSQLRLCVCPSKPCADNWGFLIFFFCQSLKPCKWETSLWILKPHCLSVLWWASRYHKAAVSWFTQLSPILDTLCGDRSTWLLLSTSSTLFRSLWFARNWSFSGTFRGRTQLREDAIKISNAFHPDDPDLLGSASSLRYMYI